MANSDDIGKSSLTKLMAPKDWYNWNLAFQSSLNTWELEKVVFKGYRTLPKPEIPDLRDRVYTKSAIARANAITKNEKNYDERYDQKRDGAGWRSSDFTDSGSKIYR
jgi:hypothetical protein